MPALLVLLLTMGGLLAQTSLPVRQLRGSVTASGSAIVTLPDGSVTTALLDPAFTLDTSGPQPVLRIAIAPAARVVRVKIVAAADPLQAYAISGPGVNVSNTLVFRNGLLMAEGDDYIFSAGPGVGTVTFGPGAAAVAIGDVIQLVAIL